MTDSKEDGANDALSARLLASHDNFARLEGVSNDDLINVLEAATALSASSPPVGGSGEVKPRLSDLLAGEQVQQDAWAAPVPNGVPEGAIVNGRTLIDRLEHHYQFACEGGSLAMCSEWQDLVRCFEHLADYAAASPVTPEGLVGGEK